MQRFIHITNSFKKEFHFTHPGMYTVFVYNISGTFQFSIESPGIDLMIFGLFTLKQNDTYKLETIQRHGAPSSTSNLLIKSIVADSAKFSYRGLIRIEKNAQKSHAYQKNQNLLISSDGFVDSRPYLEILANDVFCTHGSTTGTLDTQQLHYVQSRGLSPSEAEHLLLFGFAEEVIQRVKERVPQFTFRPSI